MSATMQTQAMNRQRKQNPEDRRPGAVQERPPHSGRYLLWIDGVGGFQLLTEPTVTIGGANGEAADLQLLAGLSRKHATLHRDASGYLLYATATCRVDGQPVTQHSGLSDGSEIELGETVRLRFRLPTVLSSTARLEFMSDHRPVHSLDAVILVEDTCLLGPGHDCHITCSEWHDTVMLVHRENRWFIRSPRLPLEVGTEQIAGEAEVRCGQVVTGPDLRFRIEAVLGHNSDTGDRS